MTRVEIVDRNTVDSTNWPANEQSDYTRRYVVPFIKNGPQSYIDNAKVRMMALIVDDVSMPLVMAGGNYGDSNVCSTYSHYVKYAMQELRHLNNRPLEWLLRAGLAFLGMILKAGRVDKVAYVNNWLFCTNPCPELSPEQVEAITCALRERFPDHAIVFRSVNTHIYRDFFDCLQESGYRMVRSRRIYILDPRSRAYLKNENVRRDLTLVKKASYEVLDTDQLAEAEVPRLTELYRQLYLSKYSFFNPQLNESFFLLTLKERILAFKALRKNGRIDAFFCYYFKKGVITGAFIGYDTKMPLEIGLFRQSIALMMNEAEKRGQLLHLSAGIGAFKMFRAAVPCIEYDAVYNDHLPFYRRLAWRCLKSSLDGWRRAESFLLRNRKALT